MLNSDDTIKESIKKLNIEFNRIKRMGYVPEVHSGYGGIGDTFERLLGKEKSDFCVPDYDGIEIKTRRSFSNGLIGLFGSVPDGKELFEPDRLREKYGYPDKEIRNAKVLYSVVYGNMLCQVGARYFFKLDVDKKEEKVFLCVFDKSINLLERRVYWSFFTLKNKLYCKLRYLMLIDAWTNNIDGKIHYKYYKAMFYKLKDIDTFIDLIDKGFIAVTFKISVYRGSYRYGLPHNHGLTFGISKEHLPLLYDEYKW